jgi:hypothetical protein
MNNYEINYNWRTLVLNFEGETFTFDLNDGDIGEFWHSFTTKDGVVKDINFSQEDVDEVPNLSIYGVKENQEGQLLIDTSDEIYVEKHTQIGNQYSYFY